MRHRRAERCLIRAEEALAAGFHEDAIEAHDEARRLAPEVVPTYAELQERIAARALLAAVPDPPTRPTTPIALGIIAVAAVAICGVWIVAPNRPAPATANVVTTAPPAPAQPSSQPGGPVLTIEQQTVQATPINGPGTAGAQISGVQPAAAVTRPVSLSIVPAASFTEPLPPVTAAAPSTVVSPPPAAAPSVAEIPVATSGAPVDSIAPMLPRTTLAVPDPPPAPARPTTAVESPDSRIRSVLNAYEAAFGSLDARAARQVWPTVDERALTRAFDGLSQQTISLGRCDIDARDTTATALCSGTAMFTPKVGGGSRTVSRQWHFALENASGAWRIATVEVR